MGWVVILSGNKEQILPRIVGSLTCKGARQQSIEDFHRRLNRVFFVCEKSVSDNSLVDIQDYSKMSYSPIVGRHGEQKRTQRSLQVQLRSNRKRIKNCYFVLEKTLSPGLLFLDLPIKWAPSSSQNEATILQQFEVNLRSYVVRTRNETREYN